ncbi:phosphatase PAP2 family protein [Quadrisphaera sp. INWT6]|uniref:phosphatase PAP2 family protein n=1 Tax=Quadrisphaera sp. INWT6 TaxID=2596917 RepID=UPI0018926BFE|nr:phosphatase PAP2 family protein [Quadrisphaera sp. INWT6]MBF5083429.1 phosphatase PAP2 family protein [Quadrisphaera sp. INWT6]
MSTAAPRPGPPHRADRTDHTGRTDRTGGGVETTPLDEGADTDRIGDRDLTRWPSAGGQVVLRGAHAVSPWLSPARLWAAVLGLGLVLDALLVVVGAWLYRTVVEGDGVDAVDHPVLQAAVDHRTPDLTAVAQVVSDVADVVGMTLLALATAVVLALVRRRWTPFVLVVTAMLGSVALTVAGKVVVGRSRPPLADAVPPYETSASFPSGHTLNATVFVGVVVYVVLRHLAARWARVLVVVAAVAFALAVGASRVYLGHHWLTDVLVAYLLGLLWVGFVVTGHRLYLTLRRHPPARARPGS